MVAESLFLPILNFTACISWWQWVFVIYFTAELMHHIWAIRLVRRIDRLYKTAKLDRDVDIVDKASFAEFQLFWSQCDSEYKEAMHAWAADMGHCLTSMVKRAVTDHPSEDPAQSMDVRFCLPIPIAFRTYNTMQILKAERRLEREGFRAIHCEHTYLYHFESKSVEGRGRDGEIRKKKPLLLVYPQFSGDFELLTTFSNLKEWYDILIVSPLGTQLTWFQRAGRHADTLEEYLPIVMGYEEIFAVTWSAGNIFFQVLDRYFELRGEHMRNRIKAVIRMDPLGLPSSNYIVYSGVALPWHKLWRKFHHVCTSSRLRGKDERMGFWNHFGCFGLSYLLKSSHGFAYVKLGRMLRVTKLAPAPFKEYLFTAEYDPTWCPGNPIFDHDRKLLCAKNVTEQVVEGFHGLWMSKDKIHQYIFPVLMKYANSERGK